MAPEIGEDSGERMLPSDLDVAIRADDGDGRVSEVLDQMLQEEEGRFVRPMQIFEDEEQAVRAGDARQHACDRLEEHVTIDASAAVARRVAELGDRSREQLAQRRRVVGDAPADRVDRLRGKKRVERVRERQVRRRAFRVRAAADQHGRAAESHVQRELLRESRLADARLSDEQRKRRAALRGALERRFERGDLLLATDEARVIERAQRIVRGRGDRRRAGDRRCAGAIELGARVLRVGGARVRCLLEEAQDERADRLRHGDFDLRCGRRLRIQLLREHRHQRPFEERPSRDELVQHRAERVEIRAAVDALSAQLLRRHVRGRAEERARRGEARAIRRERDAEVAELGAALVREPDVVGLEVAVDEPVLVHEGERVEHVARDGDRAVGAERPFCELRAHVAAGDELAHDERLPLLVADVEHGDEVRVRAQARHRAPLALEALAMRVLGARLRDERERAAAIELRVVDEIDDLLSAHAEHLPRHVAAAAEGRRQR
jgi:hypothetical protein